MPILSLLRKLADHQQFQELRDTSQGFWDETQEPSILPLLAMGYAHSGQRQSAEETYNLAKKYQSDFDSDAQVDMAAVLLLLNRHTEAATLLNKVLKHQPLHTLGLTRLGLCRLIQNDLKTAQMLFQQVAAIEPYRISVLNHLAFVYFKQSEYVMAQEVIRQAEQTIEQVSGSLPDTVYQQYKYLLNTTQLKIRVATKQFSFIEEWLKEINKNLNETEFIQWLTQYSHLLAETDLHHQAVDILREYLKQYPDNLKLYIHLAELEHILGRFIQAISLLTQALQKDENNITLWVQLSSICLHRFNRKSRMAAEKAVELANCLPDTHEQQPFLSMEKAQAQTALARVECHEQNFDKAENLYNSVLAKYKNYIPALSGLGQQKIQQGRIDEALRLFQRVKQLDPVKGNASLIIAGSFPEDIETLNKMELVAQQASLTGSVQSSILFQLAAAWEKRKGYDKAFGFARKANDASKKKLSYDGKKHRNQCFRIRMGFCRELFDHRQNYGVDTTLPVYVVGMPRSGTTLVEQILAGHSQIFGAGELGIIPQIIQGLNRWERNIGSGRNYPDCIDDLTPEVTKGIAGNVLKELQQLSPDSKHIVDKLPHNFENIGLIRFLFPDARIISVRRDPRDIALSNYFTDYQARHSGMGFAYDLKDIGEQLADHNLMMHHWHQLFPGDILEINYEDVVDNLESCARTILSYIGVPWEPDVLKFNELERPVKTASAWQVRQPVYKTSKAKWRNYQQHLKPLIEGTNAKICPESYEMMTLPEAGFLTYGVDLYRKNDLDGAELSFKKMLHHNPGHAACNYMTGMVYLRKNHVKEGIELIEKALQTAPWHNDWRNNLLKAYKLAGEENKISILKNSSLRTNTKTDWSCNAGNA